MRSHKQSKNPMAATLAGMSMVVSMLLTGCTSGGTSGSSDSNDQPIAVGSILAETGPLSVYGAPMAAATKLAVDSINESGGVLGRQLELTSYDSQSDIAKYAQYANTAVQKDKVSVLMGGVISPERDAIRPIAERAGVPYFFNQVYEGGLCDANTILTGTVPSQQMSALVPTAVEEYGKSVYVIAADYNYGRVSADWVKTYASEAGATVVGEEYIPLSSTDFGSVLNNIQAQQPDIVFSVLVGADHLSFYRQFASSGLNKDIQIVSSTFGPGNEQIVLGADAAGIVTAYPYFSEGKPAENEAFLKTWAEAGQTDPPADPAVTVWNAWHLWAAAVEQAGSLEHEEVMASIQKGVSYKGPSGNVVLDGSHHLTQDITIAQADGAGGFKMLETLAAVKPEFEQEHCDFVGDPKQNEQVVK